MTSKPFTLLEIRQAANQCQLDVVCSLEVADGDPVPDKSQTIVLLGPHEPGFWASFQKEPEFLDKKSDPVDRWSRRTVSRLAAKFNGHAVFPFGGPPYAPFIGWALRSGQVWSSPVGLLVHERAGLFVSFRGAICLPYSLVDDGPAVNPCLSCADKPCQTACPVNALSPTGYDTDKCHQYLETDARQDCMNSGCAVRRSCPVSLSYGRNPDQSAHHMKAFHP